MPHSEIHKKKRNKNYMVLGLIILFIALIWAITMVRIKSADASVCTNFSEDRVAHQQASEEMMQKWLDDYNAQEEERRLKKEQTDQDRLAHKNAGDQRKQSWEDEWRSKAEQRAREAAEREAQKVAHQETLDARKLKWWDDYRNKCKIEQ